VIGALVLGAAVDPEPDGQPDAFAAGDDNNINGLGGVPFPPGDEDGVVFTTALISGVDAKVQVTASGPGLVQGWVDWNRNGSWADASEQILVNRPVLAGVNLLQFSVPNAVASGKTYARFRLSTLSPLNYTGLAPDGEVEDYSIELYPLKTLQRPEEGSEGTDVSLATPLADDFRCSESGPITDIHIWGSFFRDVIPAGGAGNLTFALSIFSDAGGVPGAPLWSRTFGPGNYTVANNLTTGGEYWHDPATLPPTWVFPGDFDMYQFDFYIDASNAFEQVEGNLYWLGVSNVFLTTASTNGWKTTIPVPALNPACWQNSAGMWQPMFYGGIHPVNGQIDLSFALSGADQPVDADFGDAPTPYPTLLPAGARHYAVPGFYLGNNGLLSLDTEADGFPHPLALGDDLNNSDDEDGVTVGPKLVRGSNAPVTVTLTSVGTGVGMLDAWVDFNADGDWLDAGERVFTNAALAAGVNALSFPVPASATLGTNYARFRLTSLGIGSSTGPAPDGEVEDYQVEICQIGPSTNVVITNIVVTNLVVQQVITLQWNSEAGIVYQVQQATTLSNSPVVWNDVGPQVVGPANTLVLTNAHVFERYYRVEVPSVCP
jgi:hypothetical protein